MSEFLFILDQTLRIQLSLIHMKPIQNIAPKTGNLFPIHNLRRARPRLRILARHPANSDDPLPGPPDEHQTHLQQQLDLGLNGALLAVVEELRAVAALEEKSFTRGDVAQVGLEALDLVGVHDRGHAVELADGAGEFCWVARVGGGLLDGLGPP